MIHKKDIYSYPSYFENYLSLIKEEDLLEAMKNRVGTLLGFYGEIPTEKWDYAYAEGKWTIKEMVQHMLDSELVFLYRIMSIIRGEKQELLGFDENEYAKNMELDHISVEAMLNSLTLQAMYTYNIVKQFSAIEWKKEGTANKSKVQAGAIAFAIIGHDYHHRNKIKELYL
jgi:hypothetical protein